MGIVKVIVDGGDGKEIENYRRNKGCRNKSRIDRPMIVLLDMRVMLLVKNVFNKEQIISCRKVYS
jgi:hypothetical protein